MEDDTTGLIWQAAFSDVIDYEDADRYCDELSLEGRRFRVPTRIELASLLDYSGPSPAIDPTAFPGTPAARFWHRPIHSRFASSIDLTDLSDGFGDSRVRCVAETPDAATMGAHYMVDGGMIVDLKTGLRWQRDATPAPPGGTSWAEPGNGGYDLADAERYCAALELGGTKDWRVPGVLELLSLVNPLYIQSSADPFDFVHLDRSVFPDVTLERPTFHARTTFGDAQNPWVVSFDFDGWPIRHDLGADRTLCVAPL